MFNNSRYAKVCNSSPKESSAFSISVISHKKTKRNPSGISNWQLLKDPTRTQLTLGPQESSKKDHLRTLYYSLKYTWLSSASRRESTCVLVLVDSSHIANLVAAPSETAPGFLKFGLKGSHWRCTTLMKPTEKCFFYSTQIFHLKFRWIHIHFPREARRQRVINDCGGQFRYLIMLFYTQMSKHSEQGNKRKW